MSVVVILRIPGNPADLEGYAAGPGGAVMRRIAEAGLAPATPRLKPPANTLSPNELV